MSPDLPPLDPIEATRILDALAPVLESGDAVVVGGQALVALTAALELEDGLTASRDIDLLGGEDVVRRCADLLSGELRIATMDDYTNHAGIVLFQDSQGHRRQLDVLHDLYGVRGAKVREGAIEIGAVLVLHPLHALQDKLAQLGVLRTDEIAINQTRIAIDAVRELSVAILNDASEPPGARVRQALRLNTAVFNAALSRDGIRAHIDYDLEPLDALVADHTLLPTKTKVLDFPLRRARVEMKRARLRRMRREQGK